MSSLTDLLKKIDEADTKELLGMFKNTHQPLDQVSLITSTNLDTGTPSLINLNIKHKDLYQEADKAFSKLTY